MVLCFSRMLYGHVVTDEALSILLKYHRHAFEYFGGIPEDILYNKTKVVVL